MAIHSYTQPSSSEPNSVTSEPAYYGFVHRCYCGGRVKLLTRGIAPNLGRMFYSCEHDSDGPNHCSKWWDNSVEEEITTLKNNFLQVHQDLATIAKTNLPSLQDQIDKIEDTVQKLNTTVDKLKTDVEGWSAGFDYLVDYYETRTLQDFFLCALDQVKSNALILALAVGLTASVAGNLYLFLK